MCFNFLASLLQRKQYCKVRFDSSILYLMLPMNQSSLYQHHHHLQSGPPPQLGMPSELHTCDGNIFLIRNLSNHGVLLHMALQVLLKGFRSGTFTLMEPCPLP